MGAPITIKKRKMTIKSKAPTPGDKGAAEATDAADTDAEVSSEPFTDEPSNEPFTAQPPMAAAAAKPSYTVYAILAVFATLFFIALLTIQWIEWTDFIPHFPRPIQTGHIVNPPS